MQMTNNESKQMNDWKMKLVVNSDLNFISKLSTGLKSFKTNTFSSDPVKDSCPPNVLFSNKCTVMWTKNGQSNLEAKANFYGLKFQFKISPEAKLDCKVKTVLHPKFNFEKCIGQYYLNEIWKNSLILGFMVFYSKSFAQFCDIS